MRHIAQFDNMCYYQYKMINNENNNNNNNNNNQLFRRQTLTLQTILTDGHAQMKKNNFNL